MQHLTQKFFKSYLNDTDDKDLLYQIYPQKFDNTNPKYLKIDNKFVGNLIVTDYSREMQSVFLDKITSLEIDLQMSVYYEKQSTSDVIKNITYNIGNTGSELKNSDGNQADVEMISTSYSDAKYIRKQIQVNGEELYYIYIYISVYSDLEDSLENDLQKIEGIASGIGLKVRRAIFRQSEIFETALPLLKNNNSIKKYYKRNVLNSGIVASYPFISNELCDEKGVLIGVNDSNKSIVMIDRFDSNKYKNSNMCIIGTSGSGKSYFSKLMLIRNRYLNVAQYVIDPEGEYLKLCKKLKRKHNKF